MLAERMVLANIALDIFSFLLSLIPTFYILGKKRFHQKLNLYFGGMAIANMCMIVGDLSDWCLQRVDTSLQRYVLLWLSALYFAASGMILLFLSLYITEYLQLSDKLKKRWVAPMAVLCGLQVFFAVISPLTGAIFYVTAEGYQRGSLFLISQILPYLCYVICLSEVLHYRKKLTVRERTFFILYIVAPMICSTVQMFMRGISIINCGVIITFMLIFVNIQIEYEMRIQKKEAELKDQTVSIMLSQIRPHFLYNSLGTIAELCRVDPEKAENTTLKFAGFLRANMDSLKCNEPIPFARELNHVQNYLYLEKQRFGDRLQIEYQIAAQNFSLPPLPLQPLVENAVVHGVLRKKEGGCIIIKSEKTETGFRIQIIDNGIGMERSREMGNLGGHAHIGIENVRSRLKSMVNGDLQIESDDTGTTVTILVPETNEV